MVVHRAGVMVGVRFCEAVPGWCAAASPEWIASWRFGKISVRLTACGAFDLFRPRCIQSEKSPPCRMEMQKGSVQANHIVRLAGRVQVARDAFASCVPA